MPGPEGYKAFPGTKDPYWSHGMTLRQYYAAKAMQGMLSNNGLIFKPEHLTKRSFECADAMIAYEKKEQEKANAV